MDPRFSNKQFIIKRKYFTISHQLKIYDTNENLILYTKMKAFKLKEDIRVFTDESMTNQMLSIKARSIVDFSATYDVYDNTTGEKVGALKRKGLKSILKDEWLILNENDFEIGVIKEDSALLALVRRFVFNLIPQKFLVSINNSEVGFFKQSKNPFSSKLTSDFSIDNSNLFDNRLAIASGILLSLIEGKQD